MPVVGNGDIASILPDRDDLLFFASGVSNSREDRQSEFDRERELLLAQPKDEHLVYFGSLSIFYYDTPYTSHKLDMEATVAANFPRHTIIRIGNITWGDNPNTIINYFKMQMKLGNKFPIKNEYRYVIDLDEFLHWIDLIPLDFNCEINTPGRRMKVSEIVSEIQMGIL